MINTQLSILHDSIDYDFNAQPPYTAALAYELYHVSESDNWTVSVVYRNSTDAEDFYPVDVFNLVGSLRSVWLLVALDYFFANAHNFLLSPIVAQHAHWLCSKMP